MYINFLKFVAGMNTVLISRRLRAISIIILLLGGALAFGNFQLILSGTSGLSTTSLFFIGIGIFLLIAVATSGERMDHWLENIAVRAGEEAKRQGK
jgi:hypothetical protein